MSAARVVVFGASGYTGRHVVEEARSRGLRVVAHLRPGSRTGVSLEPRWRALGVEVAVAPFEAAALEALLAEHPPVAIFALLGTTRRRKKESGGADTYERVDEGLTLKVLEAAEAAAPRARLVYLSSIGAGRAGAQGAYLAARTRVEAALRASTQPFTILRPSFITGPDRPERRPAERLAAGLLGPALRLAGGLGLHASAARYAPRTGRQVALALVEAALDPALERAVLEGEAIDALVVRAEARA